MTIQHFFESRLVDHTGKGTLTDGGNAKQVEVKPNLCGFGYAVYVNGQVICIAHTLEQANKAAGKQ